MMYVLQAAIYAGTIWFLVFDLKVGNNMIAASLIGIAMAWLVTHVLIELKEICQGTWYRGRYASREPRRARNKSPHHLEEDMIPTVQVRHSRRTPARR